jgi:hypothetical protein
VNHDSRIFRYFFRIAFECTGETSHRSRDTHRYDARLLLDALPRTASTAADHTAPSNGNAPSRPDSPGGWSDLPSDAEDTFFLTPDESADLHRTKRLRHLDALRTARLRALSPDASADGDANADPWGGSDEEVIIIKTPIHKSLTRVRMTAR